MKVAVTGGHHNSALAFAEELVNQGHEIVWIGHKYAQSGSRAESAEYKEVTKAGIKFNEVRAGKFSRYEATKNLILFPVGIVQSAQILAREKPGVVVSFGGYIGATVSLVAWLFSIPVYLHEQTVVAGRANLFTSRFAKAVFTTWKSSSPLYPKEKTIHTGLPLRENILNAKKKKLFKNDKKTILVLGGKQGSHAINEALFDSLDEILSEYNVVHQTGSSTRTNDYSRAKKIKNSSYKPFDYIEKGEIGEYLISSDLVVSRSGAHTVYELALLKKSAVLIPYEYTYKKEQIKNAKMLEGAGQAIILRQSDLSKDSLTSSINKALALNPKSSVAVRKDATEKMISSINELD